MVVVDCLRLPLVELPLKQYTPIEYRAMCGFVVVVVKLSCQHSCFVQAQQVKMAASLPSAVSG